MQRDTSSNNLNYGTSFEGYGPNATAGMKGNPNGFKSSCELGGGGGNTQSKRTPTK